MSKPRPICGSKRSKGRGVCQSTALYPNGRCKVHGGPTPNGLASPHFRDGKSSSYLPQLPDGWAKHYNSEDPELVTLKRELALNLAAIREVLDSTRAAIGKKDAAGGLFALWKELEPMLKLHEKLVATESRRLKDQEELIERKEFARFARVVLMAIATHVDDRKTKQKIQDDVMRALSVAAPPIIEGRTV